MGKSLRSSGSNRAFAAAWVMAMASAWSGTLYAATDDNDYALMPVPDSGSAQPSERPKSKFQFLFDAPAKWPGALRWKYNHNNAPASYSANRAAVIHEIVAAAEKWTAVCGIPIIYDGETASAPRTFISGEPDGINVIGWGTPDIGISGATYSWYHNAGPNARTIVDSDMILDPVYVTSSAQMARTVSHEWGHALGLGHSHVAETLMSGSPDSPYSNFTDLTGDDVQGCRCLYGPAAGDHAGYLCSLPKELAFGVLEVGTDSIPQQVTVSNSGDAALAVTGLRVGGSEFFIGSNGCAPGAAVVPGGSCSFGVQARLAATGARSDELIVDTTEGSYRIPLRASGVAAPPAANANFQGVWSTAPVGSESGWGINFAHQGDVIFATWFTYDANGKAWWLTMTATRTAANVFEGALYETHGPAFDAASYNSVPVTYASVGAARLTFGDANNGLFAYTVNGISQSKAIARLVFGPMPACTFAGQPNLALATNFQDVWWASVGAGEAGWGVNFTHQGDTIFATWFTYDLDGTPLWLSATAPKVGTGVYSGTLYRTTGPPFGAVPFDPANVAYTSVGTLTLAFADGNSATFAYTVTLGSPRITVTRTKQLTRLVFRAPGTVCH
jgi:Matrixin